MPWSLQTRAAASASSNSSPATKRWDMFRVRALDVTQFAKLLLWESFRSVERSIPDYYDCSGSRFRVIVPFQELFCIYRRHASGSRRRNRLPVAMILHVARDENARNFGQGAVRGNQIAVFVGLEFALENGGVRIVTDRDENAVKFYLAFFVRLGIAERYAVHQSFRRLNGFHNCGGNKFDFRICLRAVNHDFRGAKFTAPVNQINFACVARKKIRFFHRGIAAAHHGNRFPAEKYPSHVAHVETPRPINSLSPFNPSNRADAPAATITVFVSIVSFPAIILNGRFDKSTSETAPDLNSAPNFSACLRMFAISSGPMIPSGSPGKFSTCVVRESCPPGSCPSNTTGFRFARAA